jgi:PAS domain S-box-containing protein
MEALDNKQTGKLNPSPSVIATMVVCVFAAGLLLASEYKDYPELHGLLDASMFLLSGILALFFWNMSIQQAGFPRLLAISFAVTSLLEFIHAVTGLEWSGSLAFINQAVNILRPGTWSPSAYLLPIGIGSAIWVLRRSDGDGKQKYTQGFALMLVILSLGLLAVFSWLPKYTAPGWLGITRPTLIPVLLLWITVGLACWRMRAENRILPALAWMAVMLFTGHVFMLYSHAPHDTLAMAAHLGKVSGYLILLLSMMEMASMDMVQRIHVEEKFRGLNVELERRVVERTAQLQAEIAERLQIDLLQQQTQAQLNQSEERKATILDTSLDAIITIDYMGQVLEFNPAAQKIFGYTAGEVLGKEMSQLIIPPSLREQHRNGLANYLTTGHGPVLGKRIEMTAMRADGTEFPVELTINLNSGSEFPTFTGFVRDITQRMQAEKTLRESEERFRLIVEASPSGIIAVNRDGKINMVNARVEELFGFHQEELLGHPVEILVPERFRSGHTNYRHNFLTQPAVRPMGAGREFLGLHKDGSEIPIEIGLTPYEGSEGQFTLALIIDITERKRAEEEIRKLNEELNERVVERTAALSQANSLLQMMLDHMPDQIYFKDAQSRFIRNSRSQAKALGLNDPAEIVGKSDFDFFPHAQLSFEKEQEIIRSGKPLVDEEERVVWPDGTETWVSTTKVPLPDQTGQIIGTFGISRDITDRKQAEVALQKAKLELEAANKELEAFSYSVSHDLRSPLRTIDGFSQALLEDYADQLPAEGQNYLKRVRAATQRMGQLIDDLLNLSKVTRAAMKLVPVDLSGLVQGIVAELQRIQPERRVNFKITPNLKARGDPNLMQAVLENLLNNAWKFTAKREQAQIEFGSKSENNETIYFIRDNGAGFDMTYVDKLFGAFQRLHAMTEFSGTGIGLATVQRIINRHGGRIWAEGAVDRGATFFFTLPTLERTKPEALPQENDSLARRAKEII